MKPSAELQTTGPAASSKHWIFKYTLFKKWYVKEMQFLTNDLRIINRDSCLYLQGVGTSKILFPTDADHSHCYNALCHKHTFLWTEEKVL